MLVVVALVVLMMSILVTIFSSATGAISSSRTFVELDSGLRNLDSTIRRDLEGATARFTPPLNPKDGLGYFEYAENSFSDAQNEDGDDTLSFTTKAPAGQKFVGRFYLRYNRKPGLVIGDLAGIPSNYATQPTLMSSDFAEIIYFLRNGNLYRRVLLIVPEKQEAVSEYTRTLAMSTGQFSLPDGVSWLGANDISARPSMSSSPVAPILNTLGDLTNRQNRYARPRFTNDYFDSVLGRRRPTDGTPDDGNLDGVPDYYPTMYPAMIAAANSGGLLVNWIPPSSPPLVTTDPTDPPPPEMVFAFPFIYPAAYSKPDRTLGLNMAYGHDQLGWIHKATIDGRLNHNPLEIGDNLILNAVTAADYQSWWGYPTWRETMSIKWQDPYYRMNNDSSGFQANGIQPFFHAGVTSFTAPDAPWVINNMLPPLNPLINTDGGLTAWPQGMVPVTPGLPPAFSDNAGYSGEEAPVPFRPTLKASSNLNPNMVYEDDLILTGVRSFDVKAYDEAFAGYQDLGWGSKFNNVYSANFLFNPYLPPTTAGPYAPNSFVDRTHSFLAWNNLLWSTLRGTVAHEGRIPPLTSDNRFDDLADDLGVQWPLGDDTSGVIRLRRVWDSWSTEYTKAPATNSYGIGFNPPLSTGRPFYPSYPPPYPAALRGIQINVRMVDPKNENIRSLTITQDFTDKL